MSEPCHAARTGEGYWTCDIPGGCVDCRALAAEIGDTVSIIITRDNQESDVLYVLPDGTCFVTPDGEGRIYYDTEDEALADRDVDRTVHVDSVED